ncbi:MAG TPA: hypothetical protein GXX75_09815 [Clostridiales bacterium]|nr:hypothetical protein [Clostridiales bacterium]
MGMENGNKASEQERRVDHLINLVEKQTRTERHLEEHSDISSSPENIEHAKEVNQRRQHEIDNLKDILSNGEKDNTIENTQKRLRNTGGYLNNNANRMDDQALKSAQTKQRNRAEQLDQMK